MKTSLLLVLLAGSVAAQAQTAPKPATSTAKTATTTHAAAVSAVKLPPGVPKAAGPVTTAFSLRYQDIKVGTGAAGEPNKLWKVLYTGYRASDGVKFDSSDQHRQPVTGADGKPQMDADGKPKLGDVQPLAFPQGMGRLIPGFDQGVAGMHIGGKRRLFIPWQMAYGTRDMPGTADHPGLPAKSDLIFDVELVDVTEMPAPPQGQHPAPTAAPARPATPPPSTSAAPAATPPPSSQPAQTAPQPKQ
jgi:peptidylprolyl isomerase